MSFLDFEQQVGELEAKIEELRLLGTDSKIDISEEIKRLQNKIYDITKSKLKKPTAWDIVQLARHPKRSYALDYIESVFTDFDELHGDRAFADDRAIVGGLARLNSIPVMVIGQQKGRDTKEKVLRNFGMPHPEGYRKALRLMQLAERFSLPIITLIDTPGAYPGIGAEARGQSEAIARNLLEMSKLKVPVICVIIGEGCSGGALGIGVGDRILILQYAYYATISPEGCATILWKGADNAAEAAEVMSITADKLYKLGLVDEVIPEPLGGAHRDKVTMAHNLKQALINNLEKLKQKTINQLLNDRYEKLMSLGVDPEWK